MLHKNLLRSAAALTLGCAVHAPAFGLIAPSPSSGTVSNGGDTLEFVGGPIGGANV